VPFRGSYFTVRSITDSYAPTTRSLPVQTPEVLTYKVVPSFHNHAS